MTRAELQKKKLPEAPGVYFFLGSKKEILYIGKATSLKNRVKSYFDTAIKEKRSALIEKMVAEAKTVEWTETDSVLEAMLLETNLIRTHRPLYNTRSKDDKSYNHVVITKEAFPRVLVVRGKDVSTMHEDSYSNIFGPFPSGTLFKEALKIVRKLFQFYDGAMGSSVRPSKMNKGKIDFNRQIGLYPERSTKTEYARTIRHIKLFFQGKKKQIVSELNKQMLAYAKREEFEKAHQLKKRIFALQHIQDVALIKDEVRTYRDNRNVRIEAYDVAHLQGSDMVGVMTVVENGERHPSAYRKFIIKGFDSSNDPGALKEILTRRFMHTEWNIPDIIVVDGSTAQVNVAHHVLKKHGLVVPVVAIVKDETHKPKDIIGAKKLIDEYKDLFLLANSEAHRFAVTFHRKRRSKRIKL